GVASWPTMLFTGSPTKLNSTKHRNDIASMTATDCTKRETIKASTIAGFYLGSGRLAHFIFEYLKLGESLAKIGIETLSLIDQTMSWWCSGRYGMSSTASFQASAIILSRLAWSTSFSMASVSSSNLALL